MLLTTSYDFLRIVVYIGLNADVLFPPRTVITSIVRLVLLITALGEVDQPWGGGPISVWICVEANLLIMCAALPTLRLFFKTIAPGLMSSSGASRDKTTKTSGLSGLKSRGLPTVGSTAGSSAAKPRRQLYGRFDEEQEYGMETLVAGGRSDGGEFDRRKHGNVSGRDDRSKSDDGDSQKAIVQTTTTEITYS